MSGIAVIAPLMDMPEAIVHATGTSVVIDRTLTATAGRSIHGMQGTATEIYDDRFAPRQFRSTAFWSLRTQSINDSAFNSHTYPYGANGGIRTPGLRFTKPLLYR